MTDRKRAKTVSGSKRRAKHKKLNKIERHTLLIQTVKQMGYDMSVFHLRWMPGEYLDKDTLESVPMFWFKKFGWIRKDIEQLYIAGQIEISQKQKREMTIVFGKGKGKKKRKDSGIISAIKLQRQSSTEHQVNTDDMYRRTRRLLKKVNAVPSKVRIIDNQSAMNITNVGFPDLQYISGQLSLEELNDEDDVKTPIDNTDDTVATSSTMDISADLKGIMENKEEMTKTSAVASPISAKGPSKPHHRSQNSITTPFGDIDTNTTINLRAKHRRTSSLMKRNSAAFSMSNYGEIVWNKLAILSGRGDNLTQRQFDIELQNNNILADPDICKELFYTIQCENPINKKQINKDDFNRVCLELDKIPLIDEIAADTLNDKEDSKIWIILKQIFVHIAQNESFDVAAYLTVKLSSNDLNNVDLLIEHISSRHMDWTTRLQILEWITTNLETSRNLRLLTSDDNIGPFLLGWMCQCLDERSNLAKSALEMFPNVLSIAMTQTGEAFQHLDDIFSSLFLVLRNKRSKDLTGTANECCIQCVDMIMDWHEHGELDNEVLLEIAAIFRDNTNSKEMKHDKVRERCVAYFGYILYGMNGIKQENEDENDNDNDNENEIHSVETTTTKQSSLLLPGSNGESLLLPTQGNSNHIHAKSADYDINNEDLEEEEKWVPAPRASVVGQKNAFKISKVMKRKYLLNKEKHQQFIQYINDAINNGLNDKSGDTRNTTFKLMEKLEKEEIDKNIYEEILNIDPFAMSKFNKWKQRKNRSKTRQSKKKKKSNRSRIKNHNHVKKQLSVTLTIDAQ